MNIRVFYAAGPGQLIDSHKHWRNGGHDPNLTALAYSSQFAAFCESIEADVFMVSHGRPEASYRDGKFLIQQKPKRNLGEGGLGYHCSQVAYGVWLFLQALKFKADFAIIHSSSTHFFVLSLFRFAGIKVIPVLHNTIWPAGFPKASLAKRIVRRLDGYFFRNSAHAILGVSPECLRQVRALASFKSSDHLIDMRGQFSRSYFAAIPLPPSRMRPFRVMFSGRITENKGVFDLAQIARIVEDKDPGAVRWDVCGAGPDLDELKCRRDLLGLKEVVEMHGHVLPPRMSEIIARNHAAIVPTKSTFEEGMALSAVEPVLSNRPVITSPVVPAREVLGDACMEAETDNIESYAAQVLKLANSPELYKRLCEACDSVKEPFFDGKLGFAAALRTAFSLN